MVVSLYQTVRATAVLVALILSTSGVQAMRVDNFVLLDHKGDAHDLYYHKNASAIVIMVQGNGCPIVRNALTDYKHYEISLQTLARSFSCSTQTCRIAGNHRRRGRRNTALICPYCMTKHNLLANHWIWSEPVKFWSLTPRLGKSPIAAINDRQVYERQKNEASEHFAADAIDAVLAGEPVALAKRDAIGCLINFAQKNKAHEQINYAEAIAPMLQEKCVVSYRGRPWPLGNERLQHGARLRADDSRVVRTKRMPPWHADPHIGVFKDDKSLSIEQKQTLVHWIEAGAPR